MVAWSASANSPALLKPLPNVYKSRQKSLTAQIANTIDNVLKPRGVGVVIRASHHCMATRGRHGYLVTSRMLGCFRDYPRLRQEFLGLTA